MPHVYNKMWDNKDIHECNDADDGALVQSLHNPRLPAKISTRGCFAYFHANVGPKTNFLHIWRQIRQSTWA